MNDKLKIGWNEPQSEKERERNRYESPMNRKEIVNTGKTKEIEKEKEESKNEERKKQN